MKGPSFSVTTWRGEATGLWFARVVRVRPEAAPFTDQADEVLAVLEGRQRLPDAVRAAVARFVKLHGAAGDRSAAAVEDRCPF